MLTKRLLPAAVNVFSHPLLRSIPFSLEVIGTSLQSKRGGSAEADWQEVENAICFIKRDEPVIFDVGANVGRWSKRMIERLKSKNIHPHITMFEPQPKCWPDLDRLDLPNTNLLKSAVGDASGSITFFQGDNSEVASVYERSDFLGINDKIEVPCTTLDEVIAENGISIVDYVKMDIEGHEMKALQGAAKSLSNRTIKSISFEFGPGNVNSRVFFVDFYKFVREFDMSIYRMCHDGKPVRVDAYSRNLEYFAGVANYVATFETPSRFRV